MYVPRENLNFTHGNEQMGTQHTPFIRYPNVCRLSGSSVESLMRSLKAKYEIQLPWEFERPYMREKYVSTAQTGRLGAMKADPAAEDSGFKNGSRA